MLYLYEIRSRTLSSFNVNNPLEEDKNELKPDTDKQPSFEPKRVIHRSKQLSHPGDSNRQPAAIFRRKNASPPAVESQPEATPAAQTEKRPGKGINPDLRLCPLVNAGKNVPPLKPQGGTRRLSRGEPTRRAYWDVAAGSCPFNKNAPYPQGIYICKDRDVPTSTPGVP
jgi:hypothetical protein